MSMTFRAVLREKDGVWRGVEGSPEVNLSNSNALAVLNALGIDSPDGYGSIPASEWAERGRRFARALKQGRGSEFMGRPDPAVEALTKGLGARVIGQVIDALGIWERLVRIAVVYHFAEANEADIGWY